MDTREWYLTRLINYGLDKEKLNPVLLKKYLPRRNRQFAPKLFPSPVLEKMPFRLDNRSI